MLRQLTTINYQPLQDNPNACPLLAVQKKDTGLFPYFKRNCDFKPPQQRGAQPPPCVCVCVCVCVCSCKPMSDYLPSHHVKRLDLTIAALHFKGRRHLKPPPISLPLAAPVDSQLKNQDAFPILFHHSSLGKQQPK